jgi:hypothetical protein
MGESVVAHIICGRLGLLVCQRLATNLTAIQVKSKCHLTLFRMLAQPLLAEQVSVIQQVMILGAKYGEVKVVCQW